MKKKILLLLTVLAGVLNVHANNSVTVGEVIVPQGGNGTISIALNNDDTFTAFTFKLTLPEGISFVLEEKDEKLRPTFTQGTRFDDHGINSSVDGQTATFGCLSVSSAPISGNGGVLLTVYVQADASLDVGTVLSATLSELTFTTPGEQEVNLSDVAFDITIGEARVLLDENSTTAPEEAKNVDVRVKRTINANEWSTICLPFAMTTAQLNAAFGEMGTGWKLADFKGYEKTEDDDENIVGISVKFDKATAIEANHPYLIKVSEAVSSFTVDGVDIDPEEEPMVAAVTRTRKQWSEFIGTYQAQTVVEDQRLFLSGNKFYYSSGATKMKAFRGYFDFYDVLSEVENANSRVRLVWDGQATTIAEIDAPNVLKGAVYNLNGQFMGTDVDLKSLPKGIYMVDGKKVVNY